MTLYTLKRLPTSSKACKTSINKLNVLQIFPKTDAREFDVLYWLYLPVNNPPGATSPAVVTVALGRRRNDAAFGRHPVREDAMRLLPEDCAVVTELCIASQRDLAR